MQAVEQRVADNLARSERLLVVRHDDGTTTGYSNGVLCETHGDEPAACQPLIDPALGY